MFVTTFIYLFSTFFLAWVVYQYLQSQYFRVENWPLLRSTVFFLACLIPAINTIAALIFFLWLFVITDGGPKVGDLRRSKKEKSE